MKLYLARHGQAEPETPDPPLTRRGRATIQRLALFLGTSGLEVEDVYHSGLRRAAETAEILARSVSATLRIEPLETIGPDDPIEPFLARLETWSADTLVVGHLPFLARVSARLTRSATAPPPFAIDPGTILCLDGAAIDAPWILEWLLPASLLGAPDLAI